MWIAWGLPAGWRAPERERAERDALAGSKQALLEQHLGAAAARDAARARAAAREADAAANRAAYVAQTAMADRLEAATGDSDRYLLPTQGNASAHALHKLALLSRS